jgi:hypothetical protein
MSTLPQRVGAGVAAGLIAGMVMNVYARVVDRATGGEEARGAARGSARGGRGMQPPQAHGRAEDDAAVRTGVVAYRAATGREPEPGRRPELGAAAHYAFSMGAGAAYAVLVDRFPGLARGSGAWYGLLVWAVADEGVVPALGLSRGPRQLPLGVHAHSVAGHVIYGVTLEAVRRAVSARARPHKGRAAR